MSNGDETTVEQPPSITLTPIPTTTIPNTSTGSDGGDDVIGDVISGVMDDHVFPTKHPQSGAPGDLVADRLVRADLIDIRKRHKKNGRDSQIKAIANYIAEYDTKTVGSRLISATNGEEYIFDGRTRKLLRIEPHCKELKAMLLNRYGLVGTDAITHGVIATLNGYSYVYGAKLAFRNFTYFDKESRRLFVSKYDGTMWVVDGHRVNTTNNGDGVVFSDNDSGIGCYDPIVGNHGYLRKYLIDDLQFVEDTSTGMTAEIQKIALMIWILALAFPDLLPTKPLLLIEGEQGSGKTVAIQRIMRTLHGHHMPRSIGRKDEDDFGVMLLGMPICLIDNLDNYVDWLQDCICTYATTGGWTRRKLFSDTDKITIQPHAFLAITSRNPSTFRRGDIADRCLILRMERRHDDFRAVNELYNDVDSNRDEIVGEWLWYLNQIVARVRRGDLNIKRKHAYRMADFASFAFVAGDALGIPTRKIEEMLSMMQEERIALTTEGDPLVDILNLWLDDDTNRNRPISLSELHQELAAISQAIHRQCPKNKSPATLSQHLRAGSPIVSHFEIQRQKLDTTLIYAINRKAELSSPVIITP